MKSYTIPSLLLMVCLLVVPTLAITIPAEDVSQYSVTANPGYVIYKINIDNLPMGTNQSHVLYYQGYPYLLEIETWTDYALWKNARVTFTMPNGTVQTVTTSASSIVGNYETTIQPTFRADSSLLESGTAVFIKIDLNIGLTPTSAQFSTAPMGYNPETSLPFESASGQFTNGATSDVYVYEVTKQDFANTIEKYNPTAGLEDLGSAIFQWTWEAVIGFLYNIPVLGPSLVQFFTLAGISLIFFMFWAMFLVLNAPALVAAAEIAIMAFAVINAPSGPSGFGRVFTNLYRYNVALVYIFVGCIEVVRLIVNTVVDLVTSIVQALKPI